MDDELWADLLDYIDAGLVIPVIGPELVTVDDGSGRPAPLHRWIAGQLAAKLARDAAERPRLAGFSLGELPDPFDLNDVVSLHARRGGDRGALYTQLHRLLRGLALTPPASLRALARVPGFTLFVSLTFDSLLADAVSERPGLGGRPDEIAYSPRNVQDLACAKAEIRWPVVFQLLGRASVSPDYAICDEDLLEFLHVMQDKQRQPRLLFDALKDHHLLILGCGFGDWLARFFLRTARNLQLSQRRERLDIFVGEVAGDSRLAPFLESFSPDSRVVPMAAEAFVAELMRRWDALHPTSEGVPDLPAAGTQVPEWAVFISYASEDAGPARALADELRAAKLDVWFDRDTLRIGQDWARTIGRGIERSCLFLPVISRQSLSEHTRRREFWSEWNHADAFTRRMAPGEVFIVPMVIDDTRLDSDPLPESFKRAHGHQVPQGKVTADVVGVLVEHVYDFHRRRRSG